MARTLTEQPQPLTRIRGPEEGRQESKYKPQVGQGCWKRGGKVPETRNSGKEENDSKASTGLLRRPQNIGGCIRKRIHLQDKIQKIVQTAGLPKTCVCQPF